MTAAERTVCEALVADGMYCIDRGIDDTRVYMAPIASALLRGDRGDAAMASLGRELVQQFLRDIRQPVAECEAQARAELDEAMADVRLSRRLGMNLKPATVGIN